MHKVSTIDAINDTIKLADTQHVRAEVMFAAMIYLKENPTESIEDALDFGLKQWVF